MIRRPPNSPLFPSTTLFRPPVLGVRPPGQQRGEPPELLRVGGVGRGSRPDVRHLRSEVREPAQPLPVGQPARRGEQGQFQDRKSTRLNSSHANISYAVFCLK